MNKKFFHFILILLFSSTAYSQYCKVFNTGRRSYFFDNTDFLSNIYEKIKVDKAQFNALLIEQYSLFNKIELVHISIDSSGNMTTKSYLNDSIVSKNNTIVPQSIVKAVFGSTNIDGFYESTCMGITSHKTQILVVSNPMLNKWIELACFDAHMADILIENKEFWYLYTIYNLLYKTLKPS